MKLTISMIIALLLVPCAALAAFSESSSVYDPALAQWALQIAELCSTPFMQEGVLQLDGFEKIGEYNFNRAPSIEWDIIQTILSRYQNSLSDYLIDVENAGGNIGAFKQIWRKYGKFKRRN